MHKLSSLRIKSSLASSITLGRRSRRPRFLALIGPMSRIRLFQLVTVRESKGGTRYSVGEENPVDFRVSRIVVVVVCRLA